MPQYTEFFGLSKPIADALTEYALTNEGTLHADKQRIVVAACCVWLTQNPNSQIGLFPTGGEMVPNSPYAIMESFVLAKLAGPNNKKLTEQERKLGEMLVRSSLSRAQQAVAKAKLG